MLELKRQNVNGGARGRGVSMATAAAGRPGVSREHRKGEEGIELGSGVGSNGWSDLHESQTLKCVKPGIYAKMDRNLLRACPN